MTTDPLLYLPQLPEMIARGQEDGVVVFGAVMGAFLPLVLVRFGMDPAVASNPFIASLVDVAGIVIYLNVARWLVA